MSGTESRLRVAPVALVALAWVLASAVIALVALSDARAAGPQLTCGDTITTDTTLDHNLVNCPNNGIIIGADGVTLDLNHHAIESDGTPAAGCDPDTEFCDVGVLNDGHDGVTVAHGSVRRFALGAIVGGAQGNRMIDIAAVRSRFSGLLVYDAARGAVRDSSIGRNGTHTDQAGISLFGSRRIRIVHNAVRDNGDIGVYDEELNHSRLVGNTFSGNPEAGALVNGNRNLVAHNRLRRNGDGVGIGGNENIVRRNVVQNSTGLGLQVGAGKHNLLARNRVRHVRGLGIDVASYGPVADTIVRHNYVRGAGEDGLAVRSVRKR
jgi:copper-binding protein NosD